MSLSAVACLVPTVVVRGDPSALAAATEATPSASSTTYLKAHGDAASSKYFGDRMWTNKRSTWRIRMNSGRSS